MTTILNHLTNSFLEGGASHKTMITPGIHEIAESAQEAEEDAAWMALWLSDPEDDNKGNV